MLTYHQDYLLIFQAALGLGQNAYCKLGIYKCVDHKVVWTWIVDQDIKVIMFAEADNISIAL